ncbi:diaminopimelate epimerase [Monaibacterium marinum]|uniref:Diaminopimelate epimerase n=2 Tax=Pontivivens marinum TaxID=1690039 RepID=A0A2C9CVX9_9RHOB|nr:diaminopimelate epimerase [Monaibacterium marinum]
MSVYLQRCMGGVKGSSTTYFKKMTFGCFAPWAALELHRNGAYIAGMNYSAQNTLPFLKMHGLGNDFVVIDGRGDRPVPDMDTVRAMGDRHMGVGFDQLALIMDDADSDALIRFYNTDGSESGACGNATRCVADLLMRELVRDTLVLRTERGLLPCERVGDLIRVNMGQPVEDWAAIPLSRDVDIDALPLQGAPSAVGMGNPHCVVFVEDADAVDATRIGPELENDPLYPERTNVEFIHVLDRRTIRQRTWERGAGITLACGSGACAVAVASARRGLTDRVVTIKLDGGELHLDWRDDGVWMTGPVAYVFDAVWRG